MVAIITGSGAGLERSSARLLGAQGQLGSASTGRSGENVYVNAATGNLVLTDTDESLLGRGLDAVFQRTYNSLGVWDGDNGDNWRENVYRRVTGLTGTVNTTGSTVTRTDWDGSETLYTWNTAFNAYVATDGAGAYDTLTLSGTTWTWTDGDTQVTEQYNSALGGRIVAAKDRDGNVLTYSYASNTDATSPLIRVATANGEYVALVYGGANGKLLQNLEVHAGATTVRTAYGYDELGRLKTVSVYTRDETGAIVPTSTYTTTYGYDGASNRVASIGQSDGTLVEFAYTLVGADYRITQITQRIGGPDTAPLRNITNISYDTTNRVTTVIDTLGQATRLGYDTSGNLISVTLPPPVAGAAAPTTSYSWSTDGNLLSLTAAGNTVTYDYDAHGNRVLERDSLGNTITRRYNAHNQLVAETRYTDIDTDGAGTGMPNQGLTTRYIYDTVDSVSGENYGRLLYTVTAQGLVTRYFYETFGQVSGVLAYTTVSYSVSGLAPSQDITLDAMTQWSDGITDKSSFQRTDTLYDVRGGIIWTDRSESILTTAGAIDTALPGSEVTRTNYTYSAHGEMLSRQVTGTVGTSGWTAESFTYDGFSRILTSSEYSNATTPIAKTTIVYNDAAQTTTVTLASGLQQVSVYDRSGNLVSYTESGTGVPAGTTTSYSYDLLGRLRMSTDATGTHKFWFYDSDGRNIAMVDGDGSATEYRYDGAGRITSTTAYATKLTAGQLADLATKWASSGNNPATAGFGAYRPAPLNDKDRWSWSYFDTSGRLVRTIDATGSVTTFSYDGASRLLSSTALATRMNPTTLAALMTSTAATVNFFTDPNNTSFWSGAGANVLSSSGSLPLLLQAQTTGQFGIASTNTHQIQVSPGDTLTFSVQLTAGSTDTASIAFFGTSSQLGAAANCTVTISGDGAIAALGSGGAYKITGLTSNVTTVTLTRTFTGSENVVARVYVDSANTGSTQGHTIQYGNASLVRLNNAQPALPVLPQSDAADRTSRNFFDSDGRIVATLDAEGYLTETTYDGAGRKVRTLAHAAATPTSTPNIANLGSDGTLQQIRDSTPADTSDIRNYYLYDSRGLLRAMIDGEGNVTRYHYTAADYLDKVTTGQKIPADIFAAYASTPPTFTDLPAAPGGTILKDISWTRNLYGDALTQTVTVTGGTTTVTTYQYDIMRRLTGTTTQSGTAEARTITQRYDLQGRLTGELDGAGSDALAASPGNADTIYLQLGTTWSYDKAGRLIAKTSPLGVGNAPATTFYYYNDDDSLAWQVDALGKATGYSYNAFGQATDVTVYAGKVNTSSLSGGLLTPTLKAMFTALASATLDNTTHSDFFADGTTSRTTDALGNKTDYTYTAFGEVYTVTTPLAGTATVQTKSYYDRRGLLQQQIVDSVTGGKGIKTVWGYDAFGRQVTLTDPDNNLTTTSYDRANRVANSIDALGNETDYTYDARGNLVAVKDASQQVTRYVYDKAGRRIATIDPLGEVVRTTYDADGRVTSTRRYYAKLANVASLALELPETQAMPAADSARDQVTSWTYDKAGNLASVTDALGHQTQYRYNTQGNLVAVTDAMGGITRYVYDTVGRKIATIDALGTVSRSTYDTAGNVILSRDYYTRITVPAGPANSPDPLNLEVTAAELDGYVATDGADHVTRFAYDQAGQLRFTVDGGGHVTETVHDAAGNVIRTIAYDGAISLTAADSAAIAAQIQTLNLGPAAGTRVTRAVYDAAGRLSYSIDAAGQITSFTYDAAGNLIARTEYAAIYDQAGDPTVAAMGTWLNGKTSETGDRTSYVWYDADGRQVYSRDAEGYITRNQYDALGHLKAQTRHSGAYNSGSTNYTSATPLNTLDNFFNSVADDKARQTQFNYDLAGRLYETIDPEGYRTELTLNALGQIESSSTGVTFNSQTQQLDYTKASTTTFSYDALGRVTKQTRGSNSSGDASTTWYFYDTLGRLGATVDGDNYLAVYAYDALGQQTSVTRYAKAIAATQTFTTTTAIDTLKSYVGKSSTDVTTGTQYDAFGRVWKTTDARSTVTINEYDTLDELTRQTVQAATAAGTDVWVSYAYDNFGNVAKTTDARGNDSFAWYDKLGRVIRQLDAERYVTETNYTRGGKIASVIRRQVTSNVWANNDNAALWTLSGATQQSAAAIDGNNAFTLKVSATGTAGYVTTPTTAVTQGDTITLSFWVKAGGATFATFGLYGASSQWGTSSDSTATILAGNGTLTQNNGIWTISGLSGTDATLVTVTRKITATENMFARVYAGATGVAALNTDSIVIADPVLASSAVTTFTYDRRDQLTGTTDAMGYKETYELNAFGERRSFTNKLGGVTTYSWNRRGLLESDTTTVKLDTTVIATIVNNYEYDSRGNRTRVSEASGARTTTYDYDVLDRVKQTTGDSVTVMHADLTSSIVTPTTTYSYDRRGNLITVSQLIDQIGTSTTSAITNSWYDQMGRKTDEISPIGTWTKWAYDGNGNTMSVTVYDTAVSPTHTLPATPPTGFRRTRYDYDRLNRQLHSYVDNVTTGEYAVTDAFFNGVYTSTTGTISTEVQYDAAGNVVVQTDVRHNSIYTYYDRLGRKVAQVDALRYLTAWTYDAEGNVLSERRYANAVPGSTTVNQTSDPLTLQANMGSTDDRITTFTYDENGNRLTEERAGVAYATVDATTGAFAEANATSKITYTYNGLGQVLSKAEANLNLEADPSGILHDKTSYLYDTLGRLALETDAAFKDQTGTPVSPRTAYTYDGLNNLISTRVQAGATADSTNASDRITTYTYDKAGRLITVVDANDYEWNRRNPASTQRVTHSYSYDAAGRQVRDSYARAQANGPSVTEASVTRYDLAGRVRLQTRARQDGSTWVFMDANNVYFEATRLGYDVFGDLTSRTTTVGITPDITDAAAPSSQEKFDYDALGRVWRTNSGDGVWRFAVYDKAGNQTLSIESEGADLANKTLDQVLAIATNNGAWTVGSTYVDGIDATITAYDQRNLATATILTKRQLSAADAPVNLTTSRGYNAFGEVVWERDARQAAYTTDDTRTNYVYNTLGKVTSIIHPKVAVTSETGTTVNGNPTEYYYYDLSGRLVAQKDANGNLTKRLLLAGTGHDGGDALVAKLFQPGSGVVTNGYDVFGDLRKTTDAVLQVTTSTYDKLGQVSSIAHPGGLTDSYIYDVLGQRISHTQSWTTTAAWTAGSQTETTTYDVQGRVISVTAFGGDVTTTSYVWSSSLATGDLGTFGGWTKTTTYQNGMQQKEVTDLYGHVLSTADMSGRVVNSSYDRAGRLTQQFYVGSPTDTLVYTYLNTGLTSTIMRGIYGTAAAQETFDYTLTTYSYDKGGAKASELITHSTGQTIQTGYYDRFGEWIDTGEQYVAENYTFQNANAHYDLLGRMTDWTEFGSNWQTAAHIDYDYDAAGNVRHKHVDYTTEEGTGKTGQSAHLDLWYLYNGMNLVTLSEGVLQNNQIIRGTQGTEILYDDAGRRAHSTTSVELVNPYTGVGKYFADRREDYTYEGAGNLYQVFVAQSGTAYNSTTGGVTVTAPPATGDLRATYNYDALNRVTDQLEYVSGTSIGYERAVVYNAKGQVDHDVVTTPQSGTTNLLRTTTYYDYGTGSGYALGAAVGTTVSTTLNGGAYSTGSTTNTIAWYNGAVTRSTITRQSGLSDYTTTFTYDADGTLTRIDVGGAKARYIYYSNDASGQAVRRDEFGNNGVNSPHEIWWRFDGKQLGYATNNGTDETDYQTSIESRDDTGSGLMRGGSSASAGYANFDQAVSPYTSYEQGGPGGSYTVRDGDTLQTLAAQLWGDASLWYKLAEANGLGAASTLIAGTTLVIPSGVTKSTNTASTFRPYDPSEIIGDISGVNPAPKPKPKNNCGVFGAILMVVIAVAVTIVSSGAAVAALSTGVHSVGAGISAVLGTAAAGSAAAGVGAATLITAGVAGGVVGSLASQGLGIAMGVQKSINWKGVALAGISGAISGGLSSLGKLTTAGHAIGGNFGSTVGKILGNGWSGAALRGVVSSGATQGVGRLTGLQSDFDWVGVAAAGVGGAASASFNVDGLPSPLNHALTGMAGGVANVATRSLLTGTDFGDNVLAALPDIIGNTVGNLMADVVTSRDKQASVSHGENGQGQSPAAPKGDQLNLITASPQEIAAMIETSTFQPDPGLERIWARSRVAAMDYDGDGVVSSAERFVASEIAVDKATKETKAELGLLNPTGSRSDVRILPATGKVGEVKTGGDSYWEYFRDNGFVDGSDVQLLNGGYLGGSEKNDAFAKDLIYRTDFWHLDRFVAPALSNHAMDNADFAEVSGQVYTYIDKVNQRAFEQVDLPFILLYGAAGSGALGMQLTFAGAGLAGGAFTTTNGTLALLGGSAATNIAASAQLRAATGGTNSLDTVLFDGSVGVAAPILSETASPILSQLVGRIGTPVAAETTAFGAPRLGLEIPQGMGPRTFDVISGKVRAEVGALGYGDDIFVMGSRSGGTAKAGADFDFGVRVSPERFDELIAQRFGKPNPGSQKFETMEYAIRDGRIFTGRAGLGGTRTTIARTLNIPESKVQISIIKSGGVFDNGPQTPLSFRF